MNSATGLLGLPAPCELLVFDLWPYGPLVLMSTAHRVLLFASPPNWGRSLCPKILLDETLRLAANAKRCNSPEMEILETASNSKFERNSETLATAWFLQERQQ